MNGPGSLSRRELMGLGAAATLVGFRAHAQDAKQEAVEPLPLEAVRLKPSPYLAALEANRAYLFRLEPDRLLHNFRRFAGLEPKGAVYEGWEADTIAGHTLGHYLSALALMHAQTGDAECKKRALYIVEELAACQNRSPDGYVAGFTRRRGDTIEDGRVVFTELARGEIRSAPFNLNGCWVPFYNWHKLMAGLMDAHRYCESAQALTVAERLGGFMETVFDGLNEEQLQKVLDCEHGGINESFAELYARTKNRRWLVLAERVRHRKVLDPLSEGRDELAHIHSNTQIPKLIGLARLYELTNDPRHATAAEFFWRTVTSRYSYAIGGNGDREYFQNPATISKYITEQTCEACCTYNMLKLTRHLYQWKPDAAYFDYYERAHLNHILAHQNPATGMFTYMTPLMSGTARDFSKPFDDFWCCVGSGMESHAKHGDSIYWTSRNTLYVNLYIPSRAQWREQGARFDLDSAFPDDGTATLRVTEIQSPRRFTVALRIPGWAQSSALEINGKPAQAKVHKGYALIERRWKAGDTVSLSTPMSLRLEPTVDDATTVAVLRGPAVLAADLGPASAPFDGVEPVLIGTNVLASFRPGAQPNVFEWKDPTRSTPLVFRTFYNQYERRSAVYFRAFDEAAWKKELEARAAEQARIQKLDAASVDRVKLGDEQAERDHALDSKFSYSVRYRGKTGRDARTGGFLEFTMQAAAQPLVLRATYWGDERRRIFHILVDGQRIATQELDGKLRPAFVDIDYVIPPALTAGKKTIRVRFEPEPDRSAGPVFGCRLLPASAAI